MLLAPGIGFRHLAIVRFQRGSSKFKAFQITSPVSATAERLSAVAATASQFIGALRSVLAAPAVLLTTRYAGRWRELQEGSQMALLRTVAFSDCESCGNPAGVAIADALAAPSAMEGITAEVRFSKPPLPQPRKAAGGSAISCRSPRCTSTDMRLLPWARPRQPACR